MSDPDEVRARRQRLLKRAFSNLGVLPTNEPKAEGGTAQPTKSPSSPAIPAPAQLPGQLSPEDAALAKTIESKAASIGKLDLFARLGVPRSAGRDQVKTAYFQLVKTYHPDRVPAALQHLADKVKEVFSAISEAHETLTDDKKRASYLKELEAPKGPEQKKPSADVEIHVKQAEAALKKREFSRAAELYGRAFADSRRAEFLAQQAWAIYLDPDQKAALPGVKKMLEDALRQDGNCDRAAYSLGVIARVEGDLERAERYFKQATNANPKHAEASTELRLIQMRKKKPGSGSSGLFG